jgi:hypothetical protein
MFCAHEMLPGFVILMALGATAAGQSECATNYYRFEEGQPDTVASGAGTLLDSVAGLPGGTAFGGPTYRADVLSPIVRNTGAANGLALQFNGAQSALFPSRFIFHQGYGDATLEFFIKAPEQGHHSILWTRDGDDDANRFNIVLNSNGGFGFDYRSPSGELHIPSASETLFFMTLDTWHHIAVVRTGTTYSFYLDGIFQTARADPSPDLPTASQWSISGRFGYRLQGLVDEIRFSACALTPSQFLISGCYANCDRSTTAPVLNVLDFNCFLTAFTSGAGYANCDNSTTPPVLNVLDFNCFLSRFTAGCP